MYLNASELLSYLNQLLPSQKHKNRILTSHCIYKVYIKKESRNKYLKWKRRQSEKFSSITVWQNLDSSVNCSHEQEVFSTCKTSVICYSYL